MAEQDLYTHPDYYANYDYWRTVKDLYDGNQGVLTTGKYLWYHELEGAVDSQGASAPIINPNDAMKLRVRREQRTQYYNVIKPIVSRYTSIFFLTPPTLDDKTTKLLEGQERDVTGTGQSLNTFLKDEVLFNLIMYGRAFVVTNAPSDEVKNQTEEKTKRKPRFESLSPLDVKDWQVETEGENKGKLKFIRWEYSLIPPRNNPLEAPTIVQRSKTMELQGTNFITTTYELKEKEVVEKGKKETRMIWEQIQQVVLTGWTALPVQAVLNNESWIKDLCGEALKLHNLISSRDNILYYQAYQRLWASGITNEEQRKAVTEYTMFFVPEGSTVGAVEPVNTASIESAIERTVMNIFRMAYGVTRMLPATSEANESAETKQEDRKALETLILSEIETIENLANATLKDWATFKGENNFKADVNFSRDLSTFDIQTEVTLYQALRDEIMKVPTWRKETLKRFAETQNLNDLKKVKEEIDALPAPTNGITQDGLSVRDALTKRLNVNGNAAAAGNQAQA